MKLQTSTNKNFTQTRNAADSHQLTMNPNLMGGSPITSNKPLMVLTGKNLDYSVEDAVT